MKKWKNKSVPQRIPQKYRLEILKYAEFLDKLEEETKPFVKKNNLYLFDTSIKVIENKGFISVKELSKKFNLFPIELYRLT